VKRREGGGNFRWLRACFLGSLAVPPAGRTVVELDAGRSKTRPYKDSSRLADSGDGRHLVVEVGLEGVEAGSDGVR